MIEVFFNRLYELYEELSVYYLRLCDLDCVYDITGAEYQELLESISALEEQIQSVYQDLVNFKLLDLFYWYVDKKLNGKKEPLLLGNNNLELFRMQNALEGMIGDSNFDYIGTLKSDVGRLSLKLVEKLLKNPKYQGIRDYLLQFTYGIYYKNPSVEDLLLTGDREKLELYTRRERDIFLPSYSYLDEAVLISRANDNLAYLENISEGFIDSNNEVFAKVVIAVVDVWSRLTLCDQRTVEKCDSELDYLLNSELVNSDIKEVIGDVIEILQQLQSSIKWAK